MNKLLNQTLAQIVTANHQAAAVFEKYHLDFCCKGKRPLLQACSEKNIPTEQVLQDLDDVERNATDRNGAILDYISLSQLCDYIIFKHHAYVKQTAPQIFNYLEKIANKHGDRHPELKDIFELFAQIKEELTEHMFKEENILFPRIKELDKRNSESCAFPSFDYIETPISVMEHEHDSAGDLLERIREKTANYTPPADACTTYKVAFASLKAFEADLHEHVHMENNILFPKAIAMIHKLNQQSAN